MTRRRPLLLSLMVLATAIPSTLAVAASLSVASADPGDPTPAPEPPTNLIANPSFETSTADWISYHGAITREELADAPSGAWAARVTRSTGVSFTIDDTPRTVTAAATSTPYSAHAFVKAAGASSVGKTVRLFLREATPGPPARYIRTVAGPAVTLTDAFQDLTGTITVRTDGDEVDMYVAQDGAADGDAFYIDDISLAAPSGPTPPNRDPSASFTATPRRPAVNQPVAFADTSTDADGTIQLREWDLDGDGTYETTGATPARSYATAGDVTVRLRVTDDRGATATASSIVAVQPAPGGGGSGGGGQNLIANPSFETGTANWIAYQGAITRVALTGAPDGAWVGRVARSKGATFTIDDSPETVTSASISGPYVAHASVRAATTSAVGRTVRIYLREATPGPAGTYIRTVAGPTLALTDAFQDITATMTVQAAGNEIDVYVAEANAALGDAFYIDAISLTPPA